MSKTPQEWREYLESLPEPMSVPSPWEGHDWASDGDDAYQLASEYTAKAMLMMADEDPTRLGIPEGMDDWDKAYHSPSWEAAKERWPGLDDWLGGISLNMFGWANQLVRYIHSAQPVGNPAILTITIPTLGAADPT